MFDPYIMLLHTILIIRTFVHIILFTLFRIQIVNGVSLKFDFPYSIYHFLGYSNTISVENSINFTIATRIDVCFLSTSC